MTNKEKVEKAKEAWDVRHLIDIYELAKDGLGLEAMAKAIGVPKGMLKIWKAKIPEVKDAFVKAEKVKLNRGSFSEYIYGRLSKENQRLWDQLESLGEERNGNAMAMNLLDANGDRVRQSLFLYAMTKTHYNVSEACKKLFVSDAMFRNWCKDKKFRELFKQLQFHKKNFFESKLMELAEANHPQIVWNVNKTLNRDRGFGEQVDVQVNGQVEHKFKLDELQLDLETRKRLLEAMREKKQLTQVEDAEFEVLDRNK